MNLPVPSSQPWFDRAAYPFAPHFADVEGGRMHHVDEGSGVPVLMVHGTPGWSFEYRGVVTALKGRYRCIVPDHLGFGLSDKPESFGYTLQAHTRNLETLVRQLKLERFHLVVHDFGGCVGLPLWLDQPDRILSLTVMNSWLWPLSIDPSFARNRWLFRSAFLRWCYLRFNMSARVMVKQAWGKHRPLTREVHQHYTGMFPTPQSRHGTLGFLRATTEEDAYLEGLHARAQKLVPPPSLVMWGTADSFIPPVHLERWKALLPAARVELLARVGHFPQDEAGDDVALHLGAFLDGLQGAQGRAA